MNPASIIVTIVLCACILAVPRRWVFVPFIAAACLIPMTQRIAVAGLDFTTLRFCVLAGFLRLYMRSETRTIRFNTIDKLVFAWLIVGSVIYILQWASFDAVINRAGFLFDGLGLYWLFRQMIRGWTDIIRLFWCLTFFALLSSMVLLFERITFTSPYAVFGHKPIMLHRGRLRAHGPFPHSIMLGLFWTALLPFFYAGMKIGGSKFLYGAAIGAVMLCIFLSGSSTPFLTLVTIMIFLAVYRFRAFGKQIAFSIFGVLLALHLFMNKPVWHLMARVDMFVGSTGWHRFNLFNRFVQNISEWFFLGTKSTAHWGWGLQDLTNQYVLEGVRGGVITLAVFVWLTATAIAVSWKAAAMIKNTNISWLCWGICVSVLGHAISFWGASYFGQIIMLLYLTFAMVAFVQEEMIKASRIGKL